MVIFNIGTKLFKFGIKKIFPIAAFCFTYNLYSTKNNLRLIEDNDIKNANLKFNAYINKLKHKYGTQVTTYPNIIISMKGDVYQIKFMIDQRKCDMFTLIIRILEIAKNNKNIKIKGGFDTLDLNNLKTFQIKFEEDNKGIKTWGSVCLMGEFSTERPSFELILEKKSKISDLNIDLILQLYEDTIKPSKFSDIRISNLITSKNNNNNNQNKPKDNIDLDISKFENDLKNLGATLFHPNTDKFNKNWSDLAGYDAQKRDIEDTVLLVLKQPHLFDEVTFKTRVNFESNRPKAVLFEGPPGTGKTTSAKIIASEVNLPMVYLPVESILSKYYGEAEQNLQKVFDICKKMDGCIIFIDEIDSLARSRDSDIHEVSRRLLSVLLKKLDSFESDDKSLLICATNRKQDLDSAILNRLDLSILFSLPDELSRVKIFSRYAKQLNDADLNALGNLSYSFSGRDIYLTCKEAERKFVSKKVKGEIDENSDAPDFELYKESVLKRLGNNEIN